MEVGCHQGMVANEHITVASNSYEKVKIFKFLRLFIDKSQFNSFGNKM